MSLAELEAFAGPKIVTVGLVSGEEILTGKRNDNGLWTSPGGHMDEGESIEEAAIREVKEESGIDVEASQLKLVSAEKVTSHRTGKEFVVFAFVAEVEKEKASAKNDPDQEISEWKWVPLSEKTPELAKASRHAKHDSVLRHLFGRQQMEKDTRAAMNGYVTSDATEGGSSKGRPMKEISAAICRAGTLDIPSPTENFDPKIR